MWNPATKYEAEVKAAEDLAARRRNVTQKEVERGRLYNNQTSILQWLRRNGHRVDFSNEGVESPTPTSPMIPMLPLAKYHGTECPYCGQTMMLGTARPPTRDHKIPRYRRREFVSLAPQSNIAIVCSPCNNNKGSKTLVEFAAWLVHRKDPRAPIVATYIVQIGWKEIERKVGWPSG